MTTQTSKTPLLSSTTSTGVADRNVVANTSSNELHVYRRRWWILLVTCFCSINMGLLWNTWSPITDAVQIAYGWHNSFTAILLAVSNVASALVAFPVMYLIDSLDLGYGMVLCSALLVLCCVTWNIALATKQYWLVAVGAFINGVTGAFTLASPSLISVTWFPPSERTTATSFAALSVYFGTGMAYLSGPYVSGADVTEKELKERNSLPTDRVNQLQSGVINQVYLGTALTTAAFVMAVLYFPPKPPTPPSKAQTTNRENYWQGLVHIVKNPHFWLLNIAYNLPNGLFNAWLPLCSVNFRSLGIDEVTSGWIGFTAIVTSCVLSVVFSLIVDRFKRKMKLFLLLANSCALITFTLLVCIQEKYIYVPIHLVPAALYILCTIAALCINGVIPLYYELACECAFPIDEGLICAVITIVNNIFGIVFFLFFLNPTLATDTEWMTWTCVGACALSIPLLVFMKEHFYRLDLDKAA